MKIKWLTIIFIIMAISTFPFHTEASSNIVNPKQVYSYAKMERDIKSLANRYPDLITYEVIGKSEYGRNIYAVSLGKGESTVFINGSHHAREWLTTNLNMDMIEQYARAYQRNSTMGGYNVRTVLNDTTIWFVPMVNPDGVELQQFGLSSFPRRDHASLIAMNNGSRDFKRWKANGKGVDLNRQYNANWPNIRNDPGRPSFANYKGPRPESSSEIRAIVDFTYRIDPEMAVNYHSSGEVLFWNFHQSGSRYQRDLAYARHISNLTGYRLIFPGPNPSGGGMTDWFIQEFKRPAFTPEIGRFVGPTNLPLSAYDRVWNQNRFVGLYVASEGHKLYLNRLRQIAQREVVRAEREANRLTDHYIFSSPQDVRLTLQFEQQYALTRDSISEASRLVRQLRNNAFKRDLQQRLERATELRRRATLSIRAMNRGELLKRRDAELNTFVSGHIMNDNTVMAFESVKQELTRTENAIENVVGISNRRVMSQAYTASANESIALLAGTVEKFMLLKEVESNLASGNVEMADSLLKEASSIIVSNSPRVEQIASQLEQRENELQVEIEKALNGSDVPNDVNVNGDTDGESFKIEEEPKIEVGIEEDSESHQS